MDSPPSRCLRAGLGPLIVIAGLVLALPTPSTAQHRPPTPSFLSDAERTRVEEAVFDATNLQRRRRGLPPVVWERDLGRIARDYSRRLVGQYRLEHEDASGQGPSERVAQKHRRLVGLVGENLAAFSGHWPEDPSELAREMVKGWMQSPGHRRNILRQDYTHLGVGLWTEGTELRATQLFAATQTYLAKDVPEVMQRGKSLPLTFDGPSIPAGVSLQPLGSSRLRERRQGPQFQDPTDWRVEVSPGIYRLRFYFRRTAQRFTVIDGPTVQVVPE